MISPVHTSQAIPEPGSPGSFGAVRKHDVHTGIDLYCQPYERIFTVEAGTVVAVEKFTGEHADSPWWNNTWAVLIEGESGVICYGEGRFHYYIEPGYEVVEGEDLGVVERVLKVDKGVNPPTMLHFELYKHGTRKTVWWHHGEPQPEELLDPTELVNRLYNES